MKYFRFSDLSSINIKLVKILPISIGEVLNLARFNDDDIFGVV